MQRFNINTSHDGSCNFHLTALLLLVFQTTFPMNPSAASTSSSPKKIKMLFELT